MTKKIVTWDLGATKCAAAIVNFDADKQDLNCVKQCQIKIRDCHSLFELTTAIENQLNIAMCDADAICIGAAGQYDGFELHLDKGYPYAMPFADIAKIQKWPRFAVIHDYSPIVCATFTNYMQKADNLRFLNHTQLKKEGRRVALGVGTGVGLKDGILFPNGDFWLGTNEIGHIGVSTPPHVDHHLWQRHLEFISFLHAEGLVDHAITFENILAGPGIVRIHQFFDRSAKDKSAEEIGELVRNGNANETLATFAFYLGLLIGTIQLSFMPDGGIWLTGGVILNHMEIFDHLDFFAGIYASTAYLQLRKEFPLGVLKGNDHAFMGAAYYATKRLLA